MTVKCLIFQYYYVAKINRFYCLYKKLTKIKNLILMYQFKKSA